MLTQITDLELAKASTASLLSLDNGNYRVDLAHVDHLFDWIWMSHDLLGKARTGSDELTLKWSLSRVISATRALPPLLRSVSDNISCGMSTGEVLHEDPVLLHLAGSVIRNACLAWHKGRTLCGSSVRLSHIGFTTPALEQMVVSAMINVADYADALTVGDQLSLFSGLKACEFRQSLVKRFDGPHRIEPMGHDGMTTLGSVDISVMVYPFRSIANT